MGHKLLVSFNQWLCLFSTFFVLTTTVTTKSGWIICWFCYVLVMFMFIARLACASCMNCHMSLSSFCNSHSLALAPAFMILCASWSPQVPRSIGGSNSFSSCMLEYFFKNARLTLGPSDKTCITFDNQPNKSHSGRSQEDQIIVNGWASNEFWSHVMGTHFVRIIITIM